MKYVITWETRANVSEDLQARVLQVFSKWQPSEAVNYLQFVGRVDWRGGFAVVETDDPDALSKDAAIFAPFLDYQIHPVLDIQEAAAHAGEAIEFRSSV